MEQLAPILNPREGPPEWYRESAAAAAGGFSSKFAKGDVGVEAVGGEALMLRLLVELNGAPEVSAQFPLASRRVVRHGDGLIF